MPYLNRITILGHVGRDAEVRSTTKGTRVLSFSVATTAKWKDQGGSPQERTTWHRVSKFDAPEWMAGALTKGALVYVEGELTSREYEKDGVTREAWEIRAQNVLPLDKRERTSTPQAVESDIPF